MARCLSYVLSFLALHILLPALSPAAVDNTWPGAEGGTIQALAIDPITSTTLYAGTEVRGVYKSSDSGSTWTAANNGLTEVNVQALAIDPVNNTTLYAGTNGGGVFKSTDGGDAWSAVNNGLTDLNVQVAPTGLLEYSKASMAVPIGLPATLA